jgi:hypothetical protein
MNQLNGYDVEDLRVGMSASFSKTITEADLVLFAGVSPAGTAAPLRGRSGRCGRRAALRVRLARAKRRLLARGGHFAGLGRDFASAQFTGPEDTL